MIRENKEAMRSLPALKIREELCGNRLNTVCETALCPNRGKCFSAGEATFLILGNICTRACGFCAVDKGLPAAPDPQEPRRIAGLTHSWKLKYAVFTSPTRDDIPDGGAAHFAEIIFEMRKKTPGILLEPLIPDFKGNSSAVETVIKAKPDVIAHNIETVPRLYEEVRKGADYRQSIEILIQCKKTDPKILVKSGIMLGLGETPTEVESAFSDLAQAGCDIVTIGQYLAPSKSHCPVKRYITLDEFAQLGEKAKKIGIKAVLSEPLARSSYKSFSLYKEAIKDGKW